MPFGVTLVPPIRLTSGYVVGILALAVAMSLVVVDYAAEPHLFGFTEWVALVAVIVGVAVAGATILPQVLGRD
jgi:hypothetical protein